VRAALLQAALLEQEAPEVVLDHGVEERPLVRGEGLAVGRLRRLRLAQRLEAQAEVVERARVSRSQRGRLLEVRDRFPHLLIPEV
jgi:hypothetical protein